MMPAIHVPTASADNARTVANHNPRAWKAATVGAYRLTGAEPPT